MGYEVVYDPATDTWAVWSTVVDNWVAHGLKSPEAVADFIISASKSEPRRYAIVDREGYIVANDLGVLQFFKSREDAEEILPYLAQDLGVPPESLRVVEVDPKLYNEYIRSIWINEAKKAKGERVTSVKFKAFEVGPGGKLTPVGEGEAKPPLGGVLAPEEGAGQPSAQGGKGKGEEGGGVKSPGCPCPFDRQISKDCLIKCLKYYFQKWNPGVPLDIVDWEAITDSSATLSENFEVFEQEYPEFNWKEPESEEEAMKEAAEELLREAREAIAAAKRAGRSTTEILMAVREALREEGLSDEQIKRALDALGLSRREAPARKP
ncbi:MAG: hypothetical protein C0167_03700, partial [Nitrososphaera sp.]